VRCGLHNLTLFWGVSERPLDWPCGLDGPGDWLEVWVIGGVWYAWGLLVGRKEVEEGTCPDAREAPARGEGRPRAGARTRTDEAPSESSLFEMGSLEIFQGVKQG